MNWCEARLFGAPEIFNAFTSLSLCLSAFFLKLNHPKLSIEFIIVFFLGIFSFAFHFWPCEFTRLLDEGALVSYEHLVLSKVIKYQHANLLTGLSIISLILFGKFHCLCLIFEALTIYFLMPRTIYFDKITKIFCLISIFFWSLDFRCNEKRFHWGIVTPHALWHIFGAFATYLATKNIFIDSRNSQLR